MDQRRTMSQQHKEAIRRSRRENRAVGAYLDALRASGPQRGRRRSLERVDQELAQVTTALAGSPTAVAELHLVQRRRDLEAARQSMIETDDIGDLEDAFVDVAAPFSQRKRIQYASWREVGVAPALLKRAGISR